MTKRLINGVLFVLIAFTSINSGAKSFFLTKSFLNQDFKSKEQIEISKDTIAFIKQQIESIEQFSNTGQYNRAYQLATPLFPIVFKTNELNSKIDLFSKLAILYLIFDQHKKANDLLHAHFNDLKNEISTHKDSIQLYNKLYLIQASIESNANKDFIKAEKILVHSIHLTNSTPETSEPNYYSKLNLANLYTRMYKFDEAEKLFFEIESEFKNTDHPILGMLYFYMGTYYDKKKEPELAITYYEKNLLKFNNQNKHTDLKIKTLESLSKLYYQKENYQKAHDLLSESKTISDELFGSKSEQNKALFEIRDENTKQIQHQKFSLLEKQKNILYLKSVLYISLLVIAILSLLYYFIKRSKTEKSKQVQLKKEQEEKIEKQTQTLELKNKELLSSAMQLIERDSMLEDLKKQLKALEFNKENTPIIKKIIQSLKINRSQKWKEFDTHFTTLNQSYFESLKNSFPALTKTDLKICAFIKLGFSSKDIAQITGLGVDSVNTTRSRLRKRLELDRSIVLVDFLQDFNKHYLS